MNNILAVAIISFKEGLKQRVLYGILLFALFMMTASVLLSGLFMRDIAKITLDFCLAAISIGGLLVPFFLAVNLLARDIERRTIFSLLSRSISRSQYVLGKFGGLALLTVTIVAILSLSAAGAVWTSKLLYGDQFFQFLNVSALLTAVLMGLLGLLMFTAVVVLWSCITTSSFLVTLLAVATYIIGNTMEDLVRFMATPPKGVEISPFVQKTLTAALYIFPNLAAFDLKLAAAHGLMATGREIVFLLTYGVGYTVAALCLAIFFFQRRDLV
ncbi:MAG: ABC transporter permease subunit [Chlorobium sp.]|nr:ABC transporter permease subunit [Chlorobium sp.]